MEIGFFENVLNLTDRLG